MPHVLKTSATLNLALKFENKKFDIRKKNFFDSGCQKSDVTNYLAISDQFLKKVFFCQNLCSTKGGGHDVKKVI